jgi:16S rRNA (adenine1518-N6/adenine1519-N6)-dimethyltransferase
MDNKTQPIQLNNFRPSKKMGQNFLIDEQIARSIVNLAKASDYDLVIEVGPGIGILTQYLIQFNHPVIAVELDRRLASLLKSRFSHHKNLQIINNDILKVDLAKISEPYQRVLLISNLPYSISTPMMLHFLKQNKIQIFYCMLQKELVDRLIAKPENKAYGSISVLIQYYANIAKLLDVKPSAFDPQPKVDSNIIAIQKNQRAFDPE